MIFISKKPTQTHEIKKNETEQEIGKKEKKKKQRKN